MACAGHSHLLPHRRSRFLNARVGTSQRWDKQWWVAPMISKSCWWGGWRHFYRACPCRSSLRPAVTWQRLREMRSWTERAVGRPPQAAKTSYVSRQGAVSIFAAADPVLSYRRSVLRLYVQYPRISPVRTFPFLTFPQDLDPPW